MPSPRASVCIAGLIVVGSARVAAADPGCPEPIPVYQGGDPISRVCADQLDGSALVVLDLSDGFVPRVLRAEPGTSLRYADTYRALAASGWEAPGAGAAAAGALELWGIFPTFSILRGRLADEDRHRCHDAVDDEALRVAPLAALPEEAVTALQRHLGCDGLLGPDDVDGRLGPRTRAAIEVFRRRHMVPRSGRLDDPTRELLVTDSAELDLRAVLRALRERVVDAAGILEDGSASGAWRPVLGRWIEPPCLRDDTGRPPIEAGAPDRIAAATEAAARALGWLDPGRARDGLGRLRSAGVARVAVALPLPAHEGALELRVEIDRGDVARGRRVRPGPTDRGPVLTLYARRAGDEGEEALVRWPTTIGGWQREKLPGGRVVLRHKESPPGRFLWREMIAAPVWFAPPTTPDRELVRRGPGGWKLRQDTIGPGHRSAYGLVAIVHRNLKGGDTGIRTHGTTNYLSVSEGGVSHGCHRLHTFQALRLAGFLLRHRPFATRGQVREVYVRRVRWAGTTAVIRRESRGYVRELVPAVPVRILAGRQRYRAR